MMVRRSLSTVLAACGILWCGTAAHAATHTIVIDEMKFQPDKVTVKPGDRLVWVNRDLVAHTVDAGPGLDSDKIEPGKSWATDAPKAGTYEYKCDLHPSMKALLIVK